MGRKNAVEPPPVEVVQAAFALDQCGIVVKATGEPAVNRQNMVRIWHDGRVRRIGVERVSYALRHNQWPTGLLNKPSRPPNGASHSLGGRAEADLRLIKAMSEAPHASIAHLSVLTGRPKACVSTRLGRLSRSGLTEGPQCVPGRSWVLTAQGREIAAASMPPLDDLDRDILAVIARAPAGIVAIARQTSVCDLTARRRVNLLIDRGLATVTETKRFIPTEQSLEALGPAASRPEPWVKVEAVSAAMAKDVLTRTESAGVMSRSDAGRFAVQARWRQERQRAVAAE